MRVLIRHFGLGDAIVLAGAATILAKDGPLIFPCQRQDELSLHEIFATMPNVIIHPVGTVMEMLQIEGEQILTGQFKELPMPYEKRFDQWFYEQLGIPLKEKWNSFPVP